MSNLIKVDTIPKGIKDKMLRLGFTPEKFESEASNAIQIWNSPKNTYMRKATQQSLFNSLVNLCKIGLTLNPISKESYLVPRKNGDNIEVHLEPSYIGLVKLLTDAGSVVNIQTNLVYENDEYKEFFDMNGINFNHIPAIKDRGQIVKVYCLAFLPNGNKQFESMIIEDVNKIKEKSESYKAFKSGKTYSSIWSDYEGEMIRKTCLRRIYKYLPRSVGKHADYINEAVKLDESAFSASSGQIQMIESLLNTSCLPESEKTQIESEFVVMTSADANRCILHLENNQLPGMEALTPQATDRKEAAKQKEIFDK